MAYSRLKRMSLKKLKMLNEKGVFDYPYNTLPTISRRDKCQTKHTTQKRWPAGFLI